MFQQRVALSKTADLVAQVIGLSLGYFAGDYAYNSYDAYFNGFHRIRVPVELREIRDVRRTMEETTWTNVEDKKRGDRFIQK
jgi:hypothetical protein